jgi:hypothetical protein
MTADASVRERIVELPANAAAAGLARRELSSTPGVAGALAYRALLLTSELIAACVQDAEPGTGQTLWLSIRVTGERLRVEVAGRSPDVPLDTALHSSETPTLGGMGLQIVDRTADSWGVEGPNGSMIWFELAR